MNADKLMSTIRPGRRLDRNTGHGSSAEKSFRPRDGVSFGGSAQAELALATHLFLSPSFHPSTLLHPQPAAMLPVWSDPFGSCTRLWPRRQCLKFCLGSAATQQAAAADWPSRLKLNTPKPQWGKMLAENEEWRMEDGRGMIDGLVPDPSPPYKSRTEHGSARLPPRLAKLGRRRPSGVL